MKNCISIGLLGLGTVGSGVVKIVEAHQDRLAHQIGCSVEVKKVLVKNLEKERAITIHKDLLTTDATEILDDADVDVVVEVMGGIEDARRYILHALRNKKHVVTANKDLMALYGTELLRVANENKCDLFYEASVAGGIPIIRSLVDGLAADRVTKLMGIVNGTTNFILTKMSNEGRPYEDVLKEAQELGFAESDPTSDVEGLDAARKMTILSKLGFSMDVELEDVQVRGISSVSAEDIDYARYFGYTMKLIGYAKRSENRIEVSVGPTLISHSHPLASVSNEFNAVYVYGEAVGETMFYGPGAGSLPTATAIVSDLVAVMKNMRLGVNGTSAVLPQYPKELKDDHEIHFKSFFRFTVQDQLGSFAKITSLFTECDISFEKIIQVPLKHQGLAEIILVTHQASSAAFKKVIRDLEASDVVDEVRSYYRIAGEE